MRLLDCVEGITIRLDFNHRGPFENLPPGLYLSRAQANHQMVEVFRVALWMLVHSEGEISAQPACRQRQSRDNCAARSKRERAKKDRNRDLSTWWNKRFQIPSGIKLHAAQ